MMLLQNAEVVVTMDAVGREIRGGSVLVEDDRIVAVGSAADIAAWLAAAPAQTPPQVIDLTGCVLLPGLINGHHHLYQSLTRTLGTGAGLALFDWLKTLYPIWAGLDPEAIHASTRLALAELLLSGATTVVDHLYLFPNGVRLDDEIAAAQELGCASSRPAAA